MCNDFFALGLLSQQVFLCCFIYELFKILKKLILLYKTKFRLIGAEGEIPQALAPRKLTARPTESEQPGASSNHHEYMLQRVKVCASPNINCHNNPNLTHILNE